MISKNLIKLIRSLELKKYRRKENLFVAEGRKVVGDLMAIQKPHRIVATSEWYDSNPNVAEDVIVTDDELKKVSFLQHPQQVLALFEIPGNDIQSTDTSERLVIALDGVQDPGNMGTIIRIADWFGITDIICSEDTVDAYGPKVVQATMGSIARVNIRYTSLPAFLSSQKEDVDIYGTFLDGNDIYTSRLSNSGIIIMGNEGNGVSDEVARLVNKRLFIPNYPAGRDTAESLNVAIATAITCAEFRRRSVY